VIIGQRTVSSWLTLVFVRIKLVSILLVPG